MLVRIPVLRRREDGICMLTDFYSYLGRVRITLSMITHTHTVISGRLSWTVYLAGCAENFKIDRPSGLKQPVC